MIILRIFLVLFIKSLVFSTLLYSQDEVQNGFLGLGVNYGLDVPIGELSDRFGYNFHASLSADFFNSKLNGFWGIEGQVQFGDQVKEDVVAPLRTEQGVILGFNEGPTEIFLRRRGTYIGAYLSKRIVPIGEGSSGLSLGFGAGIWQHHIRIQDENNNATHFNGDYEKGYDRNTRGPAIKQMLTYQFVSNKSNFVLGVSLMEGFTKSIRKVNFDTGLAQGDSRLDLLFSFELKWILPIFRFGPAAEIFY